MRDLWPYQREGAGYLSQRSRAMLADRPGLGKTAQAITACDMVGAARILVLCPAAVRTNWLREFDNFSPMDRPQTALVTGADTPLPDGVTTCSYELALRPAMMQRLLAARWDVLILDEGHYLKNRKAKRTAAVYGKRCLGDTGLVSNAQRVWILTGTPAGNHYGELWPHLRVAGLYTEGYFRFLDQFCVTYDRGFGLQIARGKNHKKLRGLLDQFMLRRRLEDVAIQLPALRVSSVVVEPSEIDWEVQFPGGFMPAAREEWKRRITDAERAVRAIIRHATVHDRLDALKSLDGLTISTLRRFTGLAKLPACVDRIKSTLNAGQRKLVVFAIHRNVVNGLRDALRDYNAVMYYGGMPSEKKEANLKRFLTKPDCRVFVGQLNAAGTGLDGLQTVTNRADFVEMDWSPMANAQAIMRLHRLGQKLPVQIRTFALAGSIDEHIIKLINRKLADLERLGLT